MYLRYHILQVKYTLRARTLPQSTLVACMLPQLKPDDPSQVKWYPLRYNALWRTVRSLISRPDPPKHYLRDAIYQHMQKRIDDLVAHPDMYITVKRSLRLPVWDPTLLLPCTRLERHRLVKWRIAWLPPTPSVICQCGSPKANRNHLSQCPLLISHLRSFRWSFSSLVSDPPRDLSIIDTALNHLPRHVPRHLGKWQVLWPALLSLLRRIDEITSTLPFEDEPSPGSKLLEASHSLRHPNPSSLS